MQNHKIASNAEWLNARLTLLEKEKAFTRLRDELGQARREMPWKKVETNYLFDGPGGKESLIDLFDGYQQLIIYHFMFGQDWNEGCASCSFWADNYEGINIHLNHRNINLVTVSNTSCEKLNAYKDRLGWTFKWVSSSGSEFNRDFGVSFTPEEKQQEEMFYNYKMTSFPSEEAPGISVFIQNDNHEIFHTYSCYARGLDMLNGAYHFMDLTPLGRDEDNLPNSMAWLKRHDQYED